MWDRMAAPRAFLGLLFVFDPMYLGVLGFPLGDLLNFDLVIDAVVRQKPHRRLDPSLILSEVETVERLPGLEPEPSARQADVLPVELQPRFVAISSGWLTLRRDLRVSVSRSPCTIRLCTALRPPTRTRVFCEGCSLSLGALRHAAGATSEASNLCPVGSPT